MPRRSRERSRQRSQRGGGVEEGGMPKGVTAPQMPPQDSAMTTGPMPATPSVAPPTGPPSVQAGGTALYPPREGGNMRSQYYTISGGSRRRKHGKKHGSKRRHRKQKGGSAVLATAAVPFGLLALQRYFKGSRKTKKSVANMGRSFKRTFRRRY